jgi:MFS family permease
MPGTQRSISLYLPEMPAGGVFSSREVQALLGARVTGGLVKSGLATVLGYQVYELTGSAFALASLGLVQAVPSLGLAFYGGHLADRRDRRAISLWTTVAVLASVLVLAAIAAVGGEYALAGILIVVFTYGLAQGMSRPAQSALEAQVIPLAHAARGASAAAGFWQAGSIAGAPIAGFAYALLGPFNTYLWLALLLAAEVVCISLIRPRPVPRSPSGSDEGVLQSLRIGIRYVLNRQVLVGTMALDLFAVLFGGVVAILPIYASDILEVGPAGLGVLNTAPSLGALLAMTAATRRPPMRHAGRILLLCVAGFGVSILVFAVSTSFVLSLLALFMTGVTDGLSVVIRTVILRLYSPEHLRGRIAAVNWVFIGTSNEIGAFESGLAAGLLGAVPSVLLGGSITLLVVALVALRLPEIRRLNLHEAPTPVSSEAPGASGPAVESEDPSREPSRQTA